MKEDDIDFVLVWDSSKETATSQEASCKRQIFQRHLIEEGLRLDEEPMEGSAELQVVKIRAPLQLLRRYTEILKLRMPMKDISEFQLSPEDAADIGSEDSLDPSHGHGHPEKKSSNWFTKRWELDPALFPPPSGSGFSATYSRDKEYLFDMRDPEGFFTHSIRSLIIDFILRRNRYTEKGSAESSAEFGLGIEPLLADGVYCGAYPLHDGDVKTPGSMRNLLFKEWGSVSKSLKYQPLDAVNSYFGLKVATYFAWLGFYTEMLIPVSIFGIMAFLYGVFTLPGNAVTNDICGGTIDEPMCPHCDAFCGYWNITDTCFYSKITHLFDNDATVIFSVLSSFWTIIFLERWKRYAAEIKYRWDLNAEGENDENPRPNYLTRLRKVHMKKNKDAASAVLTSNKEPALDFWRTKLPNILISMSTILFLTFMALAAVVSVILYRLAFKFLLLKEWAPTYPSVHGWGLMLANMTAVCLNLCFIVFFNWLYSFLAEYLTELELHRTQTEYDDSLTLKMYVLQFINYYASIFYIAFFKGRFAGTPHGYKHFMGYRHEECGSGGCMAELCIQLAIIMVGKQALNAIFEMGKPYMARWIKTHFQKPADGSGSGSVRSKNGHPYTPHSQAARDMSLTAWNSLSLFPEYLEMVLQFGFSTIFVSAFPLAPFFALVNNIFEIRLDANKLLKYYQRSVGTQVGSIGIWFDILNSITKLAVLANALIIAFTSNFIPKLIYRMEYGSLDDFLNHSLDSFNTSEFSNETAPRVEENHITHADVCRYHSFNKGGSDHAGTTFFWEIWIARLIFIVLYQNGIFFGVMLIQWIIPDVPKHVSEKIRQENILINKIVIRMERSLAKKADEDAEGNDEDRKINPKNSKLVDRGEDPIVDIDKTHEQKLTSQENTNIGGSGNEPTYQDSLEYVP